MSDWEAFVAKMRENPQNVAIMGIAADYLEEQGDPRAEALRWLWERGCVGLPGYGYDWGSLEPHFKVSYKWYMESVHIPYCNENSTNAEYEDCVTNRLWLLDGYAAADEATRREYLGYTTSESA